MIKTIKPMQVTYKDARELQPGMIVSEGVVIDVDNTTGQFVTVCGPISGAGRVAVYAQITPEMLDTLIAAVRRMKQERASR